MGENHEDRPSTGRELILERYEWEIAPSEDGWKLIPNGSDRSRVRDEAVELSELERLVAPILGFVVATLLLITLGYFLLSTVG